MNEDKMSSLRKEWYEDHKKVRTEDQILSKHKTKELKLNTIALRSAVIMLRKEAMIRDGIASCGRCGRIFPRSKVKIQQKDVTKCYGTCLECRAKQAKETRKRNPETYKRLQKKYNAKNTSDPIKRFVKSVRDRTNKSLVYAKTRKQHGTSSMKYIGCTRNELRRYIEAQFVKGMTWDNYALKGKNAWHVDHIIPVSSFDLSKENERHKAFHFSNLQPLWAKDNIRKSDKLVHIEKQGILCL